MDTYEHERIPADAVGLRLGRYTKRTDELVLCEAVRFPEGRDAVVTTLRRARISGRVDVGGDIKNHLVDVLDAEASIIETVALDAGSYRALKIRWMRCRTEPRP